MTTVYVQIVFCVLLGVAELITLGVLVSLRAQSRRPAHRSRSNLDEQRLKRVLEVARANNGRI